MYAYTADRRNEILARDAAQRAGQNPDLIRHEVIDTNKAASDEAEAKGYNRLRGNWVALFHYADRVEQTFSPGEGRPLVTNILASGSPLVWHRNVGE